MSTVTGTTLNYFLDDRINRAQILFPGVGCFFIAVCLGSAVHSSNIADDEAKLNNLSDDNKDGARYVFIYVDANKYRHQDFIMNATNFISISTCCF